jgi:hypothetical protein
LVAIHVIARAIRSGCLTKGCRDVRQCPGVMI